MTTRAPWAASASAVARPMPRDPPVTIATFPLRSNTLPSSSAPEKRRHGVEPGRIGDAEDADALRDALDEAREHLPRTELERVRHALGRHALHRLHPLHGAVDL